MTGRRARLVPRKPAQQAVEPGDERDGAEIVLHFGRVMKAMPQRIGQEATDVVLDRRRQCSRRRQSEMRGHPAELRSGSGDQRIVIDYHAGGALRVAHRGKHVRGPEQIRPLGGESIAGAQ